MAFQSAPGCAQYPQNRVGSALGVSSVDIAHTSGGPEKLLAVLRSSGVVLSVEGDRLAFDAPAGVVTDELLGRMRSHREELLAMIEIEVAGSSSDDLAPVGSPVASSIVCPWCRSVDLVDEPEGLTCGGCDRLAWLDLPGGGWERVDRAELDLVEVDPDSVPVCSVCGRLCDVDRGPLSGMGGRDPGDHSPVDRHAKAPVKDGEIRESYGWACSRCDPEAERRRCQTSRVLALKNRSRGRAR